MFRDNEILYSFFNEDDFLKISTKIKEVESKTSGEVRVSIKETRTIKQKKMSLYEIALNEFYNLRMDKTIDKTGILLLLLLKEKQFQIVADEGINNIVGQSTWDKIRDEIQLYFIRGNFTEGILSGIEKMGNVLAEHFPIKSDDKNELSNKVNF